MKKKEIIIITVIVIIVIVPIFLMNSHTSNQKNVQISVDNEPYKDIIFDEATKESYTIETNTGYNTILIEDGTVKVIEADCPNQVCVHTQAISEVGEMIVCLPHKLVIEITEQGRWNHEQY